MDLASLFDFFVYIFLAHIVVRVVKCFTVIFGSIYDHCFRRPLDLTPFKHRWTVVTGCTDGIGQAYTAELARARGLRCFVLIGRNAQKLEDMAALLRAPPFHCEVKTLVFDFEQPDYSELTKALQALDSDIGILVNCAGVSPPRPTPWIDLPPGTGTKILQVNLMASVRMMELLLPGMVKRNLGIIVNVSSFAGWRPCAHLSTYSASKGGLNFVSMALHRELRAAGTRGVSVQCLMPGLVRTKMLWMRQPPDNALVMDVREYARQAVRLIGATALSTGCWQHNLRLAAQFLVGFTRCAPILAFFNRRDERLYPLSFQQQQQKVADKIDLLTAER